MTTTHQLPWMDCNVIKIPAGECFNSGSQLGITQSWPLSSCLSLSNSFFPHLNTLLLFELLLSPLALSLFFSLTSLARMKALSGAYMLTTMCECLDRNKPTCIMKKSHRLAFGLAHPPARAKWESRECRNQYRSDFITCILGRYTIH